MDFFGLTQHGVSNPIKYMLRDDYQELQKPPATYIDNEYDHRSFGEKIKALDCYIGTADGYAYGSEDRLYRMRKKYLFKPVGPANMFKHPGTNSMNYGWWNCDPELSKLSKEENWFKPRVVHAIKTSEMSRFINYCLTIDKFFKM